MTQSPDDRVVSLACARTEDALTEGGKLDPRAELHLRDCDSCRELAELVGASGLISTATARAPLPGGFVDAVLERAFSETHPLDRIRPATDDLRVAELEAALERRRRRTGWVAAAALVAGLLVTAAAYNLWSPRPHEEAPATSATATPIAKAPAPVTTKEPTAPIATTPTTAPAKRRPEPAAAPAPPQPELPAPLPEQIVDIPAEIRATLLRKIRQHDACPRRNRAPVRVTLSVAQDGSVSSPQILSGSGNTKAHQCVTYAVDRLLLPPLERSVTITLDLSW